MTTTARPSVHDDGLTMHQRRWRDESALRDALAYLEVCPGELRAEAEADVASIRRRLPDRGVHAEQIGARFVRGANLPTDPPGTIRLRRLDDQHAYPKDDDEFPRGPLNGGPR